MMSLSFPRIFLRDSRPHRSNLTLLLIFLSSFSQASPGQSTSASHDFPKEAIVNEHMETTIVFETDGRYTREQKTRLRVQSEAGVQQYAILRPPYRAGLENVEVMDVHITKPNGSVVVSPLDAVQDAPSPIPGASEYANLREKHIPVKNLEPGDILEYSVRWRVDKPPAPGQFWFGHQFWKTGIVLDEQLSISIPSDREVKLKSPSVQPKISVENGRKVFTWKTANLKAESLEEQSQSQNYAAMRGILPGNDVLMSSFHSWAEVGRWYDSLQQEKIQPTADVKAKAEELTKGLVDDDAKLRAIYNYVSLRFHYVEVAFDTGRYQPHGASEVLANQYGDCKDKHTLLAALLSAVGIRSYAALISSRRIVDSDVPMPGAFDHVISVVPKGNALLWMDTTPELTPIGYLVYNLREKPALVITPDKVSFETTPAAPPFETKYTNTVTAKLDSDGTLQAHVEADYRGDDSELLYRSVFRRLPESQWKEIAQKNFYGGRLGGTITSVGADTPEKTDQPLKVTYDYTLKDFFGGQKHRFVVPISPASIPVVQDKDLGRTTPLWLGYPGEYLYESRIELPAGWSASQPVALDLKENFAEFQGSTETRDGIVVTKRRLLLKSDEITPDQMPSYKAFQKAISDNHALYVFVYAPGSSSSATSASEAQNRLLAITSPWTDAEKEHFRACLSRISNGETDTGLQRQTMAAGCLIGEEERHWTGQHPEAVGRKQDTLELQKCLQEHFADMKVPEAFHRAFDTCMSRSYGLPVTNK
jgi:hypothetical protein